MFFCFSLLCKTAQTQELILNGGFENNIKLTEYIFANSNDILYWNKKPVYKLGQKGYIHPFFIQKKKGEKILADDLHFYKRNGFCYAEIREGKKIGSVLYCKLNSPLIKDTMYNLSFIFNFYVTEFYNNESTYIDFLFLKKPLSDFNPKTILKSQATVKSLKIINHTTLPEIWDSVRLVFKAKGEEEYIYIIGRRDKYYKEVKNPFLDTSNNILYSFNIDNISLKKRKTAILNDTTIKLDPYKHFKPDKINLIDSEFYPVSCYVPNGRYFADSLGYNQNFINHLDNLVYTLKMDDTLKLKINFYRNIDYALNKELIRYYIERYINYLGYNGIDLNRIEYEIFEDKKLYNPKYKSLFNDDSFNVSLKLYKK